MTSFFRCLSAGMAGILAIALFPTIRASEETSAKQLDENRYQIGSVVFNKETREIRFPAILNMREGLLEFLIVHENGKIHESLFRTTASATNINLALTLLRYKPSKELYRIEEKPGIVTGKFHEEPQETQKSARISLEVEYEADGSTKRVPVSDWVTHEITAKSMPPTYWVYGGSFFQDGKFAPDLSGDIAAIFITNSALINYPGKDNLNDDVWTVTTSRTPELETNVTIVISPFKP
ncbi:YdjY domain-containing protein [Luteolibacter sp. AS25]|uniref:YdjY domain-containing protein n=1 Tax=Luteolibacter sp. AS25 TaxID=3135776 RepID=UPI00398AEACA